MLDLRVRPWVVPQSEPDPDQDCGGRRGASPSTPPKHAEDEERAVYSSVRRGKLFRRSIFKLLSSQCLDECNVWWRCVAQALRSTRRQDRTLWIGSAKMVRRELHFSERINVLFDCTLGRPSPGGSRRHC